MDRRGLSHLLLARTRTNTVSLAASSLLTPLAETPGRWETLVAYLTPERRSPTPPPCSACTATP